MNRQPQAALVLALEERPFLLLDVDCFEDEARLLAWLDGLDLPGLAEDLAAAVAELREAA